MSFSPVRSAPYVTHFLLWIAIPRSIRGSRTRIPPIWSPSICCCSLVCSPTSSPTGRCPSTSRPIGRGPTTSRLGSPRQRRVQNWVRSLLTIIHRVRRARVRSIRSSWASLHRLLCRWIPNRIRSPSLSRQIRRVRPSRQISRESWILPSRETSCSPTSKFMSHNCSNKLHNPSFNKSLLPNPWLPQEPSTPNKSNTLLNQSNTLLNQFNTLLNQFNLLLNTLPKQCTQDTLLNQSMEFPQVNPPLATLPSATPPSAINPLEATLADNDSFIIDIIHHNNIDTSSPKLLLIFKNAWTK